MIAALCSRTGKPQDIAAAELLISKGATDGQA